MAFVLAAMGDKLQQIVDVTIAYPQGVATFWDFVMRAGKGNQG
jgi:hypothetical protein